MSTEYQLLLSVNTWPWVPVVHKTCSISYSKCYNKKAAKIILSYVFHTSWRQPPSEEETGDQYNSQYDGNQYITDRWPTCSQSQPKGSDCYIGQAITSKNDTHLQWTITGPAPSWLAAADFKMKSNAGYSQPASGAPWSGQPVKWYCNTSIGFTSSSVASWAQTFTN